METKKQSLPEARSLFDLHKKLESLFEQQQLDMWVKFIDSFDWESFLTRHGYIDSEIDAIINVMYERILFSVQITKLDEISRARNRRTKAANKAQEPSAKAAKTRKSGIIRALTATAKEITNEGAIRLMKLINEAQKKK